MPPNPETKTKPRATTKENDKAARGWEVGKKTDARDDDNDAMATNAFSVWQHVHLLFSLLSVGDLMPLEEEKERKEGNARGPGGFKRSGNVYNDRQKNGP